MKRHAWLAVAFTTLGWLAPSTAFAHKPSDSYLTLRAAGNEVGVRWDIALRDLDDVLRLDADGDDTVAWGELRRRERDVADYALPRLRLSAGGSCRPRLEDLRVVRHSDGAYAVLDAAYACDAPAR